MSPVCIADASDSQAIQYAAQIIRDGGLVAFPTETVYGLGADAENPVAVARIFEVKRRPHIDPLIVHVADMESARHYGIFSEAACKLCEQFWPGPLTLVAARSARIPPIVTAGLDTVAIRVPSHPAALALIRAADRAIAAPSANLFGHVSPTEAEHVADQLGTDVDLILDGGPTTIGVESTILSFEAEKPVVLRAGGTTLEELQAVLGPIGLRIKTVAMPSVPGQMKRHYSTRTPLEISEDCDLQSNKPGERIGLLTLTATEDSSKYAVVEVLSPSGDLREAAAQLFRSMRRLDDWGLDRIIARPVPETGLGLAIMDRLRRAESRTEVDE